MPSSGKTLASLIDAIEQAYSWEISFDGDDLVYTALPYDTEGWEKTSFTKEQFSALDRRWPTVLNEAPGYGLLTFHGARLREASNFMTGVGLRLPAQAFAKVKPAPDGMHFMGINLVLQDHQDGLQVMGDVYQTKLDPVTQLPYAGKTVVTIAWLDHAWLDQHYPLWRDKQALLNALGEDGYALAAMLFKDAPAPVNVDMANVAFGPDSVSPQVSSDKALS